MAHIYSMFYVKSLINSKNIRRITVIIRWTIKYIRWSFIKTRWIYWKR